MSGRLIGVFSGKGGTGKTMLTAALGAHWALLGRRVVLVDMNFDMRGLDMQLGLHSRIGFDLGDVLDGTCGLDKALVEDSHAGLHMIAAPQFGGAAPLKGRTLQLILEVLCLQNDYVLLDAPGPTAQGFDQTAALAQESLLLTTPDDAALRNAERTATLLRERGKSSPLLVINKIDAALVDAGLQYLPEICASVLDMPVIGVIPEDPEVLRSTLEKQALAGLSPAGEAIDNLADRLDRPALPLRPWRQEEEPALRAAAVESVAKEEAPSEQAAEETQAPEAQHDSAPPSQEDPADIPKLYVPAPVAEAAAQPETPPKKRRLIDILRGNGNDTDT